MADFENLSVAVHKIHRGTDAAHMGPGETVKVAACVHIDVDGVVFVLHVHVPDPPGGTAQF